MRMIVQRKPERGATDGSRDEEGAMQGYGKGSALEACFVVHSRACTRERVSAVGDVESWMRLGYLLRHIRRIVFIPTVRTISLLEFDSGRASWQTRRSISWRGPLKIVT